MLYLTITTVKVSPEGAAITGPFGPRNPEPVVAAVFTALLFAVHRAYPLPTPGATNPV